VWAVRQHPKSYCARWLCTQATLWSKTTSRTFWCWYCHTRPWRNTSDRKLMKAAILLRLNAWASCSKQYLRVPMSWGPKIKLCNCTCYAYVQTYWLQRRNQAKWCWPPSCRDQDLVAHVQLHYCPAVTRRLASTRNSICNTAGNQAPLSTNIP